MAHFKYPQFVLLKFDDSSLDKSYLIYFFHNSSKSLIKVMIENGGQELCNWENLI